MKINADKLTNRELGEIIDIVYPAFLEITELYEMLSRRYVGKTLHPFAATQANKKLDKYKEHLNCYGESK